MNSNLRNREITAAVADRAEMAALAVNVLAAVLLLSVVLINCRAGFDFSDEGFYLNWISDPQRYRASATQFGFVYHPLYELLSDNVAMLRRANVLASFTLAFALCALLLPFLNNKRSEEPGGLLAIALIGAACSLSFFELWITSPNYNSLNLQSTIIVAIGATFVVQDRSRYRVAAWLLIALGVTLSFLAKPSTALLLLILLTGYIIIYERQKLLALCFFICATTTFIMLSAWVVDGAPGAFVRRLIDGGDLLNQLREHSLRDYLNIWHGFGWSLWQIAVFPVTVFLAAAFEYFQGSKSRLSNAIAAIVFGSASLLMITASPLMDGVAAVFMPFQILAILLGRIIATRGYRSFERPANSAVLLAFFAVLPLAYAFGTSANFWPGASRAAIFWLIPALFLNSKHVGNWRGMLNTASLSLLVVTGSLCAEMEHPYRQTQALRLQSDAVEINSRGATLVTSSLVGDFIRDLRAKSNQGGFKPGDFMLDMTGASPGSLYVLGARPLGAAWTLSGYSGSQEYLSAALQQESCEAIGASWILWDSKSPHSFSLESLRPYGIDSARDLADLGVVGPSPAEDDAPSEVHLLRPLRDVNLARLACENLRREASK